MKKNAVIYSIVAQKGGVGKSTTAATLTAGLTLKGYKALMIDLDGQRSSSFLMGADLNSDRTALDLLLQDNADNSVNTIQKTPYGDVIAGDKGLFNADAMLTDTGKEYRLKEAIEPLRRMYDYIIIDTPPALGTLTINALTTSDYVIIPADASILSLQSIADLIKSSIAPVKKYTNKDIKIAGVLLTRYNLRGGFNQELREMTESLSKNYGCKVFNTTIREAIAVRKAQANVKSIFEYAPKEKVTEDYTAFIDELLLKEKGN